MGSVYFRFEADPLNADGYLPNGAVVTVAACWPANPGWYLVEHVDGSQHSAYWSELTPCTETGDTEDECWSFGEEVLRG